MGTISERCAPYCLLTLSPLDTVLTQPGPFSYQCHNQWQHKFTATQPWVSQDCRYGRAFPH